MKKYIEYKGRLYRSIDSAETGRHTDKLVKKALDEGFNYAVAAHTQFKKVIEITGDHSYLSEVNKLLDLARSLYRKL